MGLTGYTCYSFGDQRVKSIEGQVTEADTSGSDWVPSAAPNKEPGNSWVLLFFPYAARKKYIVLLTSSCKCFASYKRFFTDYAVESCCAKFLRQKAGIACLHLRRSPQSTEFCSRGRFRTIPHKAKKQGA